MTTDTALRSFSVFACEDGPARSHRVDGESFEDAAIGFVEVWHPPVDAEGEVAVMVTDCESGRAQCLKVDVGGEVTPCD